MANVIVHVWHNLNGEIVAVGRPMGTAKCVPLGGSDQTVLEAEIDEQHIGRLHQTHVVDTHRKTIVKYSGS